MSFVKFRCKLQRKNDPERDCGRILAGPSYDTIRAHDYSQGPFEDIRYCEKHGFLKITITSPTEPAIQEPLGKSFAESMISAESVFGAVIHKMRLFEVSNAG